MDFLAVLGCDTYHLQGGASQHVMLWRM